MEMCSRESMRMGNHVGEENSNMQMGPYTEE